MKYWSEINLQFFCEGHTPQNIKVRAGILGNRMLEEQFIEYYLTRIWKHSKILCIKKFRKFFWKMPNNLLFLNTMVPPHFLMSLINSLN